MPGRRSRGTSTWGRRAAWAGCCFTHSGACGWVASWRFTRKAHGMATDTSTALNRPSPAAHQRSFYTRVSALGFGLIALAGIAVLVAGLLAGDVAANAGFGLAFIVIGLLLAALIWLVGRGALFVAGGLAFLLL